MAVTKVLISGVTGYIGGSVLAELLENNADGKYALTAIIRKPEQAASLEQIGVMVIHFNGLDDLDACQRAASEHDVVIGAANVGDDAAAEAWIRGLGQSQKANGGPTCYIHTTGSSVLGFKTMLGPAEETKVWSDRSPFSEYVTEYPETYKQRDQPIPFFALADSLGVKTFTICPTTVYGVGKGVFSKMNGQIQDLISVSVKLAKPIVVGQGQGIWSRVHVEDLAKLYSLLLFSLSNAPTPANTLQEVPNHSIIWSEDGEHNWRESSASIADLLMSKGKVQTTDLTELDLTTAADELAGGDERMTAVVWASSSRGKADLARDLLGWRPQHGDESWARYFEEAYQFVK